MILFFYFGLSVALFLFLLAMVKRNKNHADQILATWMGFMTLHLTLFVLDYSKVTYEHPHLLGILLPLPVVHGFFLYTYTWQVTTNRFPGWKFVLLHMTPFFLLVILAIPFYLLPSAEKLSVFLNRGQGYEWYGLIQISVFVIFGIGYSITSILQIRKHRQKMFHVFSNHDKKKLVWLEWMAYGLGGIWLLALFFNDQIVFSGVVAFILFIGVFGINQTPVFLGSNGEQSLPQSRNPTPAIKLSPEKYQKSGLGEDDASRLSHSLQTFMANNKPYKNPDLTLDELATLMAVNPNQLSQVINSRTGKSFYHYINSYRIKEFLALASLPESNKFTYLGLASDCGFQSKTTFNKYFKLETGKTPSEYFQQTGVTTE